MPQTVFQNVQINLDLLVEKIAMGEIGLPYIQRPFVWDATKVRDLFDSMYRGFPVGHLLLWQTGAEEGARQIGVGPKQAAAQLVIVDGQQRLTSLYAVMKRHPIVGRDYAPKDLRIAFRPTDATFAVPNAATEHDPSFLNDIGELFSSEGAYPVIQRYLNRLDAGSPLSDSERARLAESLTDLANLRSYQFTALQLHADVPEEEVAEVFVRVNSQGKNLNQADFILTLMSVYWEEGRVALEHWSRDVRVPGNPAWNWFASPEPDELLRVGVAMGFRRGRLADAYGVLRGRDRSTGKISPDAREEQFTRLKAAQDRVLDTGNWGEFLQCLVVAGHRSRSTISSTNALLYAYAFFLIGKHDYGVPAPQLRSLIARWFFMSTITGRYSASPETTVEADLGSLPEGSDATSFVQRLEAIMDQQLTNDFWSITFPGYLESSTSRSGSLFGYLSALCVLDAPVLFSKMLCSQLLDPSLAGGEARIHRHHLFPKSHLEQLGVVDVRKVNQIANLALLEWRDNLDISDEDPAVYWPRYVDALRNPPSGMPKFSEAEVARMCELHGLPEGWQTLDYETFLRERRRLIGTVVREAFAKLVSGESAAPDGTTWPPTAAVLQHLLGQGETDRVEMKSSLRADLASKGVPPQALEHIVARTVAGFLNREGGLLVIGADDHGHPIGLGADMKTLHRQDVDGFQQALVQTLSNYLGAAVAASVRIALVKVGPADADLALVQCRPHPKPVYVTNGQTTEFHVRTGNTTRKLDMAAAQSYIATRWKGLG